MSTMPGIVTHNYDPLYGPFGNICTLPDAQAQRVLDSIALSGRRLVRENYLRRRRTTEAWLLSERQRKMGAPVIEHPIYFFLADMADGLASDRRSYHGKVFTIEEIGHVIAEFGMPCGRRRTIPPVKYDRFIEVQLWDDRPLRRLSAPLSRDGIAPS